MKKSNETLGNIGMIIAEIIIGTLLLIKPVGFTKTIIIILGVILILSAISSIIGYFRTEPSLAFKEKSLSKGLFLGTFGLFCTLKSDWIIITFPILTTLYGIGILLTGFQKIEWAVDGLRLKIKYWFIPGISALLSIIFAIIIIRNPFDSVTAIWMFTGASLIVEAVIDFVSVILKSKND